MTTSPAPTIRPTAPADEARWKELFRAYREFYRLEPSEEIVSRVWSWITDPDHEVQSLVAEADGVVRGVVACRPLQAVFTVREVEQRQRGSLRHGGSRVYVR